LVLADWLALDSMRMQHGAAEQPFAPQERVFVQSGETSKKTRTGLFPKMLLGREVQRLSFSVVPLEMARGV